MIDGLERIDWGRLTHAYGSAADVPGLIRDLTSRRRKKRRRALWELFGNIHHQGTVYSATAPAVPFLAEIARSEATAYHVRVELAWLLAAIAGGSSYLDVHREHIEQVGDEVDERELAREISDVQAAREAVRRELPTLTPLIETRAAELSLSVAVLAARFPELSARTLPSVRRAYDGTTSPEYRDALALVLILLGDRRRELLDRVAGVVTDDHVDPEMLGDAVTGLEHGETPEEAFSVLEDLTGRALRGWDPE